MHLIQTIRVQEENIFCTINKVKILKCVYFSFTSFFFHFDVVRVLDNVHTSTVEHAYNK